MNKTIRKAFKFRLKLTHEADAKLNNYAGGCRFAWNKALALNLDRLNDKQPILWYLELNFWATIWKQSEEYGFLKDVPSQALQQKLKDLDKAFRDCFDKNQPLKRCPVFKKKGLSDSIRFPQGFKIDQENSRIFLPKIGLVKYRNSRRIVGNPKNVTISKKGKHWYASIQVEYDAMDMPHKSTSIVGIDMGVKKFATLSDGVVFEPLNSFKGKAEKSAKLQRKLKHKKKFSSNWKKAKAKITKCHEEIANARKDYLHKVSTEISKSHAVVVVEDLKVRNMSKSAKGSIDKPGKNIAQKSGLNKSILDQGWGVFFQMLEYKQNWNGGMVLKVPAHHTSQTCPCCQHVAKENRLTQAEFVCVECGYTNNADIVGAINVLSRGHRQLACQASGAVMPPATGTSDKRRRKVTSEKSGITASLGR
ncbi:RNA-guided endonuclease InsQ/TnpB family protein [Methylobacter marinus]|uniref:RNA-guided endonuclease InsQ/TnpB family protein n=1 Tax=Methylobacter marinus TaxID=34058 RepID=UPI00037D146F|nr:RNA-guided endonuclease TnpB family protein [Methylobacter marinus]